MAFCFFLSAALLFACFWPACRRTDFGLLSPIFELPFSFRSGFCFPNLVRFAPVDRDTVAGSFSAVSNQLQAAIGTKGNTLASFRRMVCFAAPPRSDTIIEKIPAGRTMAHRH
jgi:hypothetical protein